MTKTAVIYLSLFIFAFASWVKAESKAGVGSPAAALVAYHEALKAGDLGAAKSLTADFPKLPAEYVDRYTAKYSAGAKANKLVIKLVPKSSKVLEDCAVITFEDGDRGGKERPDYDPAYLIKQEGKWRVFLKLTNWEHSAFEISEEQKKRFAELEEWFDGEKDRLNGR